MIILKTNSTPSQRNLITVHLVKMDGYILRVFEYRTLTNRRLLVFRLYENDVCVAIDRYFVPLLFHVKQIINEILCYEYGIARYNIKKVSGMYRNT